MGLPTERAARSTFDQAVGDRKPGPQSRRAIIGELGRYFTKFTFRKSTFAPLAVKNAGDFDTAKRAAMHAPEGCRQLPDHIAFRFVHVKLGDVRRVEITHG